MNEDDYARLKMYLTHPKKGINRFRLSGDLKNKKTITNSKPIKIELVITKLCNLKCEMCFAYRETKSHMPLSLYKKIAKELFPTAPIVFLIGGEPTLHPDFKELIKIASAYGCKLQMTTNGTVLREDEIPMIVNNFERINISFDGGTKETYEKIRCGAKFEKVIDNIKRLREARDSAGSNLKIGLTFCSSIDNVSEIPDLVNLASDIGIDFIKISTLKIHPGIPFEKSLYFHKKTANKYYKQAREQAEKYGIEIILPGLFDLDETKDKESSGWKQCTYAWDRLRITADGVVVPCCNLMDIEMGNVKEDEFSSIWNNSKYQKFRGDFQRTQPKYAQCAHCRLILPNINDPYSHIDQDPKLKKQMDKAIKNNQKKILNSKY